MLSFSLKKFWLQAVISVLFGTRALQIQFNKANMD
ncbi:hypothetical protein N288_11650 [Bacillus infantis NRRL B-14911]|uniref:Uncharacterized protein n=1 Tax=Bacillus infantis NRRL B-14911 TaxID=1367477 RepID=U5LA30_9BACI|nr:hypothetical protein N288_11650 [Bacillus infantis NRRL B-14911]